MQTLKVKHEWPTAFWVTKHQFTEHFIGFLMRLAIQAYPYANGCLPGTWYGDVRQLAIEHYTRAQLSRGNSRHNQHRPSLPSNYSLTAGRSQQRSARHPASRPQL